MNLTWHIVRKDFLRFRILLLAWAALLVAKVLFLSSVAGVFGSPNVSLLPLLQYGQPLHALVSAAAPLFALFIVAALVFEDPTSARDPFWVTRPIAGGQLLAAKLLGAALMLVVPAVLADVAWWLTCGLTLERIASFSAWTAGNYGVLALVGLACASATNGYPRFVVWLVAGVAAVIGCHLFPLVFHVTGKQVDAPRFYGGVVSLCLVLLSSQILFNRFLVRRFRASAAVGATLTLAGSAWLFSSAPAALVGALAPKSAAFTGEEQIRAAIGGEPRKFGGGGLAIPLRVDQLPANLVTNTQMQATWRSTEGKVWTTKSGHADFRNTQRRVARRVLGLSPEPSTQAVDRVSFIVPQASADRIIAEASMVEGTAYLHLNEASLLAELPLRPQVHRFAGGSLTLSDVVVGAGDASVLLTTRLGFEPEPYYGVGYVALVNRHTGEMIEAAQDQPLVRHPLRTEHDASLSCFWLRFKIPNRAWLDEARFVVVGMGPGHSIERAVPPYVRTSRSAQPLRPPNVTVSTAILQQYTGTYRPRPGAKLTIAVNPRGAGVNRGGLAMQDSGFFKVHLFPESDTRFRAYGTNWLFAGDGDAYDTDYVVDFKRDATGAVNHFVVTQNGREFVVPRLRTVLGAEAEDADRMDQFAQFYTANHQFMGTVLVARGDKVLLSKGYGAANLETGTLNSPQTKFRIGSLTKQFTAAAILLLEEQGKLHVSDPVKKYLPDAPAAWDQLTIHQLLNHTSGFPSYTSLPDYPNFMAVVLTPRQLVGKFRDLPLEFAPGSTWKYSNSNYALLGYLIERISGQPYAEFLQANIFGPIGMKDSGFDGAQGPPAGLAIGYRNKTNEWVKARFVDMSVPFAAGGIYSTTEDLLRWERSLFGGKLLSPVSFEKMTTPVEHGYAYGLGVGTKDGHKEISHNGAIDGFYSHLAFYPDERLTVVVLGDVEGPGTSLVSQRLTAIAHGAKPELPSDRASARVSPDILRQYVGTYQFKELTLFITLNGDHLSARGTNIPPTDLLAESETRFYANISEAVIEFVKDDKGVVTHFVAHENGHDTTVRRTSTSTDEPSSGH